MSPGAELDSVVAEVDIDELVISTVEVTPAFVVATDFMVVCAVVVTVGEVVVVRATTETLLSVTDRMDGFIGGGGGELGVVEDAPGISVALFIGSSPIQPRLRLE